MPATVGVAAIVLTLLSWAATLAIGAQVSAGDGGIPAHCTLGTPVTLLFALRVGALGAPGGMHVHHVADPEVADSAWWRIKTLPPGGTQTLARTFTARRRGTHTLGLLRIDVIGPFGLAFASKTFTLKRAILVRPPLIPLVDPPGVDVGKGARVQYIDPDPESGETRTYRVGDEPRHIHWRTSARRGRLMVRQQTGTAPRTARLVLDLDDDDVAPHGVAPDVAEHQPPATARVEQAIVLAVALAHRLMLSGWQVRVDGTFGLHRPLLVTDEDTLLDWAALLAVGSVDAAPAATRRSARTSLASRSTLVGSRRASSQDVGELAIHISTRLSATLLSTMAAVHTTSSQRVLLLPHDAEVHADGASPGLPVDWHVVRYGSSETLQETWDSLRQPKTRPSRVGPTITGAYRQDA